MRAMSTNVPLPNVCTNRLEIWGDPSQLAELRGILLSPDMTVCLADVSAEHGGIIDHEHLAVEFGKRHAFIGYGTNGRPFPGLFWQDLSSRYRRLTFANVYGEDHHCFAGVTVWKNGHQLYERHIDNYMDVLPDPDVYDDNYMDDSLIDLMITLSLEAALFP